MFPKNFFGPTHKICVLTFLKKYFHEILKKIILNQNPVFEKKIKNISKNINNFS